MGNAGPFRNKKKTRNYTVVAREKKGGDLGIATWQVRLGAEKRRKIAGYAKEKGGRQTDFITSEIGNAPGR